MDNPLTPKTQNALIEDALHTYPVMPMPRDITVDVVSRIKAVPASRPFHLTWQDLVLGFVLSVCIAVLWFSLNSLPPLVVAHIRKESILMYQQMIVNARWLIPVLSLGLAGFFAALTLPFFRQELMK
jgi:hypothetical protein